MRALHCIPSMGSGGTERQLVYLTQGLIKIGWEIHVALLYGGANMEALRASGAKVHELSCRNNYDPTILIQLVTLLRKIKPAFVQTWLPQMDILGGFAALLMGLPFAISERSNAPAYKSRWKGRLRALIAKKASLVIANSNPGKAYWITLGKQENTVRVIRNAIPIDKINEIPSEADPLSTGLDTKAIVFAGRLSYEKNIPRMIKAFAIVSRARPNTRIYLFGEGPMKDDILELQSRHNLGKNMNIMGFSTDLWSAIKNADLFVLVSTFEGNPNTVLEAVACKCPVVVSDIEAHRDFLAEDSAFLVSPYSPESIAEGILQALENIKLAKQKAEKAFSTISEWTINATAQKYADLYAETFKK